MLRTYFAINDYTNDGGEELNFLLWYTALFNRIPIESLRIRN